MDLFEYHRLLTTLRKNQNIFFIFGKTLIINKK